MRGDVTNSSSFACSAWTLLLQRTFISDWVGIAQPADWSDLKEILAEYIWPSGAVDSGEPHKSEQRLAGAH